MTSKEIARLKELEAMSYEERLSNGGRFQDEMMRLSKMIFYHKQIVARKVTKEEEKAVSASAIEDKIDAKFLAYPVVRTWNRVLEQVFSKDVYDNLIGAMKKDFQAWCSLLPEKRIDLYDSPDGKFVLRKIYQYWQRNKSGSYATNFSIALEKLSEKQLSDLAFILFNDRIAFAKDFEILGHALANRLGGKFLFGSIAWHNPTPSRIVFDGVRAQIVVP